MSQCSTLSTCNENSEPMQESSEEQENDERGSEDTNGFDILFQGIELLNSGNGSDNFVEDISEESLNTGLSILCQVTRNDTFEYGLSEDILTRNSKLDINLLCTITGTEYYDIINHIDPIIKLKEKYKVMSYINEISEKNGKEFIHQQIRKYNKEHPENVEDEKYDNIKALAKMVKKIKNMEIMSQLEVDLRLKSTELQNNYREKQKIVAQLRTPKKKKIKNKKINQRGPGRPKKRSFPNPKSKMGRPRKHPKVPVRVEFESLEVDL